MKLKKQLNVTASKTITISKFSETNLSIKISLQNQKLEIINIILIRMGNCFIKSHLLKKMVHITLVFSLYIDKT